MSKQFSKWINSKTQKELDAIFYDYKGISVESLEKLPEYCKYNILFNNGVL